MANQTDFDVSLFVKETQLQHGLRGEDYERYHAYLTNRVATIRRQLHLSNDKKKFLKREITPSTVAASAAGSADGMADSRFFILLLFYAERCWASAEAVQARRVNEAEEQSRAGAGDRRTVVGGVPPSSAIRKRLNKAVKWATLLSSVADMNGSPRVQQQCRAYLQETLGRCHASHGKAAEAKQAFLAARALFFALLKEYRDACEPEASITVIRQKVQEMDDRVIYSMQLLKENVDTYRPEHEALGEDIKSKAHGAKNGSAKAEEEVLGAEASVASVLYWNGRTLDAMNIKVKDLLREAKSVPVEALEQKTLWGAGTPQECPLHSSPVVPTGQMNRVLDALDRRIAYYNDALGHTRQELRIEGAGASTARKTTLQLTVHCLLFLVAKETLNRKLFMAEVYGRRFRSTEQAVQALRQQTREGGGSSKKRKDGTLLPQTQFISSSEVVRVYMTALETVEEMELLPGVAGRTDVEAYRALSEAGKVLYIGEGWRVLGDLLKAEKCYQTASALLCTDSAKKSNDPRINRLLREAQSLAVRVASLRTLAAESAGDPNDLTYAKEYLLDGSKEEDVVCVAKHVLPFPPDYQLAAAKPTFVDIAFTFLDFEDENESNVAASHTSNLTEEGSKPNRGQGDAKAHPHCDVKETQPSDNAQGKKWGFKWGWGSNK